jgi:hypothetical protein
LRLPAYRTPGGWRIKPEDLERFFQTLTADRLSPGTNDTPKPAPRSERVARMRAELAAQGF